MSLDSIILIENVKIRYFDIKYVNKCNETNVYTETKISVNLDINSLVYFIKFNFSLIKMTLTSR